MKRNLSLACCFILFCCSSALAQKKSLPGEMLEKTEGVQVAFTRDTFPKNYATKYIIFLNDNEIYEVNFFFFRGNDSSSFKIFYVDKRKINCGTIDIKFENGSSYYIVKNFKPNEDKIDYEDISISLLFSVPDKDEPYVILNKFLSFGDEEIRFKLTPLDPVVVEKHRVARLNFIEWEKMQKDKLDKHKDAVSNLVAEMRKYKDSVINSINNVEEINRLKSATRIPEKTLQDDFKTRLDTLFYRYLRKLYRYDNSDIDITFSFSYNGNKKFDSKETRLVSNNGKPFDWFRDSFRLVILPQIEAGSYSTIIDEDSHPDLIPDFMNRFKERMNKINPDGTEFREGLDPIITTLREYEKRKINVPTKYSYTIRYRSETIQTTWKYFADDRTIKTPRGENMINEDLRRLFIAGIAGNRSHRYDIEICTVYINDKQTGQDIREEKKK